MDMLNKIEQWIDKTNTDYKSQRVCCSQFKNEFADFYPLDFLNDAFYVVVNNSQNQILQSCMLWG